MNSNIYSVILCGGSGTRLWPLSRKNVPKQFLSLDTSSKSLLEQTLVRVRNISSPDRTVIVTGKAHIDLCVEQVKKSADTILIEPFSRNTAPAIALAAWELLQKDPESTMVILPSDHYIQNVRSFEYTLQEAVELAAKNLFVVIGIEPSYPATGFGYIELGTPMYLKEFHQKETPHTNEDDYAPAYLVRSFREKPNLAAAEQFLRTGRYLWNAGMFVWKTKVFWEAFKKVQPRMCEKIESINEHNFELVYKELENISIDIGFIERTSHIACVPARFDWNDVGSWSAVRECLATDEDGNTLKGNVFTIDTVNSVVHTTGPFVSVVGLENVAVVVTADAVLVTDLSKSQDVKKIIVHLESEQSELL